MLVVSFCADKGVQFVPPHTTTVVPTGLYRVTIFLNTSLSSVNVVLQSGFPNSHLSVRDSRFLMQCNHIRMDECINRLCFRVTVTVADVMDPILRISITNSNGLICTEIAQ